MVPTTIAIIADCDDTLAPDTTGQLLDFCGVNQKDLFAASGKLVDQGWDPVLAYMRCMTELSKNEGPLASLNRERIQQLAKGLTFFPGVPQFFTEIKNEIENQVDFRAAGIRVELYVVSSGIQELLEASVLGDCANRIWGSDFEYSSNGIIECPKKVVSHTDKTRFVYRIQKGQISPSFDNRPYVVNAPMAETERPVPFENMVYLGDGPSDIPCMSLITSKGGFVIGMLSNTNANKSWALGYGRRANLTVPPNYEPHEFAYKQIREWVWQRAQTISSKITGALPVPQH